MGSWVLEMLDAVVMKSVEMLLEVFLWYLFQQSLASINPCELITDMQ